MPPCSKEEIALLLSSEEARNTAAASLNDVVEEQLSLYGISRSANNWDRKNYMVWARELAGYPRLKGAALFDPSSETESVESVKIIDRGSSQNNLEDGIQKTLLKLVNSSTKSIVIQNPYVVLTSLAVNALAQAGQRGVRITIITNSPVSTDSELTQGFFVEKWPAYLAAIPNLQFKSSRWYKKTSRKNSSLRRCCIPCRNL